MPAKNAPSAKETPNSSADPNAMPSASASTASVNSSREPVPAMRCSIQGIARRPTISIRATKAATLPRVSPSAPARASGSSAAPSVPFSAPATAGSSTSASTIARSSTISQPTAIRPRSVSSRCRSCSARSSTTVLATDSASPNTRRSPIGQPSSQPSPAPSSVARPICTSAPGIAIARTDSRSRSEKCRPTPNISRITPISASSGARSRSATKPGVHGPMTTPASR